MTAISWVGAIFALAAAVVVLAAAVGFAIQAIDHVLGAIRHQGYTEALEWQKNKLRSAAWWFSEDPPTRELLADLAQLSEWEARDRWRKKRAPSASSGAAPQKE